MREVAVIASPQDAALGSRIVAELGAWGIMAAPAGDDPRRAAAALVLWTAAAHDDPEFAARAQAVASEQRVDARFSDRPLAAGTERAIDLSSWREDDTAGWMEAVERLSAIVYGNPDAAPRPAPAAPAAAEPPPPVQPAAMPKPPEPPEPEVKRQTDAVSSDIPPEIDTIEPWRGRILFDAAPWIAIGAALFILAVFVGSAVLGLSPPGTAGDGRGIRHAGDSLILLSIFTPLFALPPLLWLRARGVIGWILLLVGTAAMSLMHFGASYAAFVTGMALSSVSGDSSVLPTVTALAVGSVLGGASTLLALWLLVRRVRTAANVGVLAKACAALIAITLLPALAHADARLLVLLLFPPWQMIYGLAIVRLLHPRDAAAA